MAGFSIEIIYLIFEIAFEEVTGGTGIYSCSAECRHCKAGNCRAHRLHNLASNFKSSQEVSLKSFKEGKQKLNVWGRQCNPGSSLVSSIQYVALAFRNMHSALLFWL